jgi:hypothetical protein
LNKLVIDAVKRDLAGASIEEPPQVSDHVNDFNPQIRLVETFKRPEKKRFDDKDGVKITIRKIDAKIKETQNSLKYILTATKDQLTKLEPNESVNLEPRQTF